jgi:copper homeostasis protein (lipoprotein)
MIPRTVQWLLAVIMVVAVPAMAQFDDRESVRDRREREAALGALPAEFTGLLPCSDCVGIRYQINLLPGGAYMQRMIYLRDGHDDSYYELGAWSLSRDGRTLTLDGGRDVKALWVVVDPRTLRKLDREGRRIDSKLSYELRRRPGVEAMEPRVRLLGMFRYMADAPRFRDCRSGLQWPVAMSDDYRALERAYIERRAAPGSELLVSVNGRIEQWPKMEGGGTQPTMIVEKFVRAMPGETCKESKESAPRAGLANTRWRPVRIGDRPVSVSGQRREPWIVLDSRSNRVTGSGGCNQFAGSYEAGRGTLRFGPLISTKVACPSSDTETAFFRALGDTRRYRVLSRVLELLDDGGRLLVRLEERNLR